MTKSPEAFRTISEVADWLDVPAHVLRFWESRFAQVKPLKRAGGRRYYRPTDMELLGGIKRLLHDDGLTIRGVQKLLREEGVRHVAAYSPAICPDKEPDDMDAETAPGQRSATPSLFDDGPQIDGVPPSSDAARPANDTAPDEDARFGISPDLYPPRRPVLAGLLGLSGARCAAAGVDAAAFLDRARALRAAMDDHG